MTRKNSSIRRATPEEVVAIPESIRDLSFEELRSQCSPISQETVDRWKKLVEGVEFDRDNDIIGGDVEFDQ